MCNKMFVNTGSPVADWTNHTVNLRICNTIAKADVDGLYVITFWFGEHDQTMWKFNTAADRDAVYCELLSRFSRHTMKGDFE